MIDSPSQEGTPWVKRSGRRARVKVSADGRGVVSHAGSALLRELASESGLLRPAHVIAIEFKFCGAEHRRWRK